VHGRVSEKTDQNLREKRMLVEMSGQGGWGGGGGGGTRSAWWNAAWFLRGVCNILCQLLLLTRAQPAACVHRNSAHATTQGDT
jgi:hypothetical protein